MSSQPASHPSESPSESDDVSSSSQTARRLLFSLMFPSMLMPMVSSMSRVALPIIRDHFQIRADMTAWVSVAFALPFMVSMPVYGRLCDGLDKRRLMLTGIAIFGLGSALTVIAPGLGWLMAGRAIQGLGVAGMIPLCMALISANFRVEERGRTLGIWSSVGPTTGFLGPLIAGFLVALWGWRGAFGPPLIISVVAFAVVYYGVPGSAQNIKTRFFRAFDWGGVVLLAGVLVGLIFFLSSRAITGIMPLHDWRLLGASLAFLGAFVWWERGRVAPFIALDIFGDGLFCRATFCATMRMFCMGGLSFLVPLYLTDVHHLAPAKLGGVLMANAGAMALIVRFGGRMADRWRSRWLVVVGLLIQALVMLLFSQLPGSAPIAVVVLGLGLHGLGAGLMLAALHRAVMGNVPAAKMGAATGLYSMFRFIGAATGTALSGVILQAHLDAGLSDIAAYQGVFALFVLFPVLGMGVALGLREAQV